MNKKQSGEFITASIFHSPPLFQPEWPSDFPSALLALVSVSPHAALGRAPASLPQLHVPPTSELVLRVRVQPKRVQCILRSTCAPFIILSPQARPMPTPLFPCFCPLLGYLCVCLVLPPASGVLEDQGDSWLPAPGLPPLPHHGRCPWLCCPMALEGNWSFQPGCVHCRCPPAPSEVMCSFLIFCWVVFLVEAKTVSCWWCYRPSRSISCIRSQSDILVWGPGSAPQLSTVVFR